MRRRITPYRQVGRDDIVCGSLVKYFLQNLSCFTSVPTLAVE